MLHKIKTICVLLTLCYPFVGIGQNQIVEVNGIKHHIFIKGLENRKKNAPIVIFESGMAVDLGNWDKIIDEISTFIPVFAYDRSGIGKSDHNFNMPTVKFVSENLHNILSILNIPPPYILVGHSLGGVYIRSFAGYYPNEVSGLVFIDPADFTESKNNWNDIFRKMGLPEKKIDEMLYQRLYQTSKTDSINFGPWSEGKILNELRRTDFAEINSLPLPHVPLYFFIGGKFEVPIDKRSKDYDQEAFFHIKNNANMERWKNLIYTSNKGGSMIYITNAGHYIHRDDPKSVIANLKLWVEKITE